MTPPLLQKKKQKRLKEWNDWVKTFKKLNKANPAPEYSEIPHAAELLNDYYWRLALSFLKPLIDDSSDDEEHFLHYYKIISASELTVMAVLPFSFVDKKNNTPESLREINAEFAWFIAISIMVNWKIGSKHVVEYSNLEKVILYKELIDIDKKKGEVYYPWNFRDEHIAWLKSINVAVSLPILSNSQTWRMVYQATRNK